MNEERRKVGTEKSIFVPLYSEYYWAFATGRKTQEFRKYGPRWNERVCRPGRPITLSHGYGKKHRLHGTVASFERRGNTAVIGVDLCKTN